jgi:hypothetical protein
MARDNELRRRQAGSSSGPSSPTKSTTSATPSSPKAASTSTKLSRASNALNNLKPHHDPLDLQIKADDDGSLKVTLVAGFPGHKTPYCFGEKRCHVDHALLSSQILAPGTPLDEIECIHLPSSRLGMNRLADGTCPLPLRPPASFLSPCFSLSEIPLLHHLQAHPPKTLLHKLKSTRIIFPLGLLVGALLAYFLISPLECVNPPSTLSPPQTPRQELTLPTLF